MKKFKLLINIQIKEHLTFFTKKKLSVSKKILYIILPILILGLSLIGAISTAASFIPPLQALDRLDLLLPSMLLLIMVLFFLLTVKIIKSMLFMADDINFLKTLPIKPSLIPLSKISLYYFFLVFLTLILLLATDIVLLIMEDANNASLFLNLGLSFLIPILPIMLATFIILPFSIMAKSYRISKLLKFLDIFFTTILTIPFITVIILAPFMSENHVSILDNVINNFFFTYLYKETLNFNLLYLFIFITINLILLSLFIIFLNKFYFKLHNILSKKDKKKDYETRYLKNASIPKALLSKEMKLYKSADGYVMNTLIFAIIIGALAIAVIVLRLIGMSDFLIDSQLYDLIIILIPLGLLLLNSFTATTAVSISLEGANFYLLKVLPIKTKQVLDAKIKLHMIMLGIIPAFSAFIIGVFFNVGVLYSLIFFIILLCHSYFMANFGIIINLLFPKLNHKTQISVIKNSLASLLMMLFSQLLLIPIALPVVLLGINASSTISIVFLVSMMIIYAILARLIVLKKSQSMFNKLNY